LILGHNHPAVVEAIERQLASGTVLGGPTHVEIDLAEQILEGFPSGEHVVFCSSGTEANMIGLRMLRALSGKEKIVKCDGAFHGTSDSFVTGVGVPNDVDKRTISVPFNDIDEFERAVRQHKGEIAAVFMEPVTRGIPPKEGYLKAVREITKEHRLPLVFDEVVTGFRFTWGGVEKHWGVSADMTILGKIIGGGLPAGAVVASKDVFAPFELKRVDGLHIEGPDVFLGGTYNGHPLAMAAGLATLKELSPEQYKHINELGLSLRIGMEKASEKAGIRTQSVGIGSIFNLYFTKNPIYDVATSKTENTYLQRCFDLGLITKGVFPAKAHCSFISTPTSAEELDRTLEAVEQTLYELKPVVQNSVPELIA
jgi:glutamate-1-semialdehyde 2,1-aminomutase